MAIAGPVELADVRATLKLENAGQVNYITLSRFSSFSSLSCLLSQ